MIDPLPEIGALAEDVEAWEQYDGQGQDARRARWTAIVVAWVNAADKQAAERLGALPLIELADLDVTLSDLRYEIRRAVEKRASGPTWTH